MTKLEMVNEMGLIDLLKNQRQKEQALERCLAHKKEHIETAYNHYKNGSVRRDFILCILTGFAVKEEE